MSQDACNVTALGHSANEMGMYMYGFCHKFAYSTVGV